MIRHFVKEEIDNLKTKLEEAIRLKELYDKTDSFSNLKEYVLTEKEIDYEEFISIFYSEVDLIYKLGLSKDSTENIIKEYIHKNSVLTEGELEFIDIYSFNYKYIDEYENELEEYQEEIDGFDTADAIANNILSIAQSLGIKGEYARFYEIIKDDDYKNNECFSDLQEFGRSHLSSYEQDEDDDYTSEFFDIFLDDMTVFCFKNIKIPECIFNKIDKFRNYHSGSLLNEIYYVNNNLYISITDSLIYDVIHRELLELYILALIFSEKR